MRYSSLFPQALGLILAAGFVNAQDTSSSASEPTSTTTSSSETSTETPTVVTKVVQIFFVDERSFEGLPYTLLHRDSGSVVNIEAGLTTYVITTTRVDQRSLPTNTPTDNATITSPTLASTRQLGRVNNTTGPPSTITQGPATFLFTGTHFGPGHTLINRCSLNGTVSAVCNLTHVGSVWYTRNTAWNGTYSTYKYNWTSGDRFGFAPVTITAGAELLSAPDPTASGKPNTAARGSSPAVSALLAVVVALLGTMAVAGT